VKAGETMTVVLLSALVRASADVMLYAYLPVYVHLHLREERVWLISLLLAAPATIRLVTAPRWGKRADETGRHKPFVIIGLLAYAGLVNVLPRLDDPLVVIVVVSVFTFFSSALNPVARAW